MACCAIVLSMIDQETKTGGNRHDFPATSWSVLINLHDPNHPAFEATLNHLVKEYWKPAYHYIRAQRRLSVEDAKDLTQQFFTMLFQRQSLDRLSPDRGSFRGFLKTAIRYFLISSDRAKKSREPRDGLKLLRIDEVEHEWIEMTSNGRSEINPDEAFDREWVRGLLSRAVEKLEWVLIQEGKKTHFALFQDFCLRPIGISAKPVAGSDGAPPSYKDLAKQYKLNEFDVKNYLHYARQKMRPLLRDMVMEYVHDENDIDQELKFILSE